MHRRSRARAGVRVRRPTPAEGCRRPKRLVVQTAGRPMLQRTADARRSWHAHGLRRAVTRCRCWLVPHCADAVGDDLVERRGESGVAVRCRIGDGTDWCRGAPAHGPAAVRITGARLPGTFTGTASDRGRRWWLRRGPTMPNPAQDDHRRSSRSARRLRHATGQRDCSARRSAVGARVCANAGATVSRVPQSTMRSRDSLLSSRVRAHRRAAASDAGCSPA